VVSGGRSRVRPRNCAAGELRQRTALTNVRTVVPMIRPAQPACVTAMARPRRPTTRHKLRHMTPPSRSIWISPAVIWSRAVRTWSVCSPRRGGGLARGSGESGEFQGGCRPTSGGRSSGAGPLDQHAAGGCLRIVKTRSIVFTGAQGMPAASSAFSHAVAGRRAISAARSGRSTTRF